MGCGSWSRDSFVNYSKTKGVTCDSSGSIIGDYTSQDMFKARSIDASLSPKNIMRECCDTEEHPTTIPVILALDVTGSMGKAAVEVAKKLNSVMTRLYEELSDVEFAVMGVGDLAYDSFPIQLSQFESDIRIAESLDKVFFEYGGGGNGYESYSVAWYMGLHHTKLDCWNRNKRGIIITMGDEKLNPYLPQGGLEGLTGDSLEGDIQTGNLFEEAVRKYDIYHIDVLHSDFSRSISKEVKKSFETVIGSQHFKEASIDDIEDTIVNIIINSQKNIQSAESMVLAAVTSEGISW